MQGRTQVSEAEKYTQQLQQLLTQPRQLQPETTYMICCSSLKRSHGLVNSV